MDIALLVLRLVVGLLLIGHGTQKLFGWFGGYGPDGTGQFFESVGLRPGKRNAVAAGATETAGGALTLLGLATPAAAAGITAVMITALKTVIWKEGIKPATGEFEVVLATGALALAEAGPGSLSLDAALGRERAGTGWALAALAAGAAGSALALEAARRAPQPPPAASDVTPATAETAVP